MKELHVHVDVIWFWLIFKLVPVHTLHYIMYMYLCPSNHLHLLNNLSLLVRGEYIRDIPSVEDHVDILYE